MNVIRPKRAFGHPLTNRVTEEDFRFLVHIAELRCLNVPAPENTLSRFDQLAVALLTRFQVTCLSGESAIDAGSQYRQVEYHESDDSNPRSADGRNIDLHESIRELQRRP
jgi:hypothetical protein